MHIKSYLEKHTVTWLKAQDTAGKLNKNISIQRREIWDVTKKSNLIVSLLLDIPIESLLFEESEKKSHNVLDGKQRTLTLCAFVGNEFPLSPMIRVKEIDGISLVGMKFSMLPEELQSKIMEYELSISVLRSLDTEERATVFFMRNQAVPLSKMDLSLVILGEAAMNTLSKLCDHSFMINKVKLTAPARRKHDDLSVLLQYMILQTRSDMGFSGTEIMSFCDDIKNEEINIPDDEITALLDYLDEAITEKRTYLKKMHIPIVLYTAQLAREKSISSSDIGVLLDQFFNNLKPDSEYTVACQSGSSKRAGIQLRLRLMSDIINGANSRRKTSSIV